MNKEGFPTQAHDNDDDGVVTLRIGSAIGNSVDKMGSEQIVRFTESPGNDNDSQLEVAEDESYEVNSFEGLQKASAYVRSLREELRDWESSLGGAVSSDGAALSQYLREQMADISDLIRYQNDALASGAGEDNIEQRAEKIAEAINILSEDYVLFSEALEDESGEMLRELASSIGDTAQVSTEVPENAISATMPGASRSGFAPEQESIPFDSEGLKQQFRDAEFLLGDVVARLSPTEFTAVEGSYEQLQTMVEVVQEKIARLLAVGQASSAELNVLHERWKDCLRLRDEIDATVKESTEEGAEETDGDEEGVVSKKRFVAYPISEPSVRRKTVMVNGVPMGSYPEEKKGSVMMSSKNPEELFEVADGEVEVEPDTVEAYRDWLDGDSTDVEGEQPEEVSTPLEPFTIEPEILQGEVLEPEVNPRYATVRREWLEAKTTHEEKHAAYHAAVKEYYESLSEQGFRSKNWTRLKASFGVKPQLPADIAALREEMFAATEAYNTYARQVIEVRALEGKKSRAEMSPEVLARYHKLLARTTLLNTFNAQLELQGETAESLAFKGSVFLTKHARSIRIAGAAVIGGLTGGVAAGGLAVARVLTAGAVGGVVTGVVGEMQDRRVERIKTETAEQYRMEVDAIEAMLNRGGLSAEELEESYQYLSGIYYNVDRAMQVRIAALLATAIGSGFLVGASFSLADALTSSPEVGAATPVPAAATEVSPTGVAGTAGPDTIVLDVSNFTPEATADGADYTALRGDNLWDIMEGQTEAGRLEYLDHVAEEDRQRLIALVTERVNEDAALRAELGFGETASHLQVGDDVDVERLNELAEEIAREQNLYIDTPPADTVAPPTPPAESVSATPAGAGEASPATQSERLVLQSASPDRVIEFAREYDGGYTKFETDFQTQFVERIQGPAPADSLFGRLFGGPPNSADAFKVFGPYTVGEFTELARADEVALARALANEQIDMADYTAWKNALAEWQQSGLVINPRDRFEDVANAAFINSLSQSRTS